MHRSRPFLFLALAGLTSGLFADSLTLRETSQGKTTRETATLTRTTEAGLSWETVTDKTSTRRVGRTSDGTLVAASATGPEGQWTLTVEDDVLKATGTIQGKPTAGSLALKGRLWSMGFDQPLRWAVTHHLTKELPFLMINPANVAQPQEMLLTPDGNDSVEGRPALRFKLGLPGAMALFWSATIWADPQTGEQMQYKGNKGPGTPDVVLIIDRTK